MSKIKYKLSASIVVGLLMSLLVLTACGDEATATPKAIPAPTTLPSITVPSLVGATTAAANSGTSTTTQAAGATTTAASGATQAAAVTTAGGPASAACIDADAAPAVASGPKPTPVSSAPAALPNLAYSGARDVKATDNTLKLILSNLNNPGNEAAFGKFTADKVNFSFTTDTYDKVEANYRKLLEAASWQLIRGEADAPTKQSILVYQKDASKVVVNVVSVDDIANYPAEFKDGFKPGDTLILISSGLATGGGPAPTAFAIPGNPILEVKPGQRKLATIELDKGGKIVIELCPNLAPKTVENFEKLATKNFFNGLTFHRVEKDPKPFVVQGGDPKGDGTGGPGYQIPDEFTTQKKHLRGTVAMAHSQAPNSAGSQFYICLDAAPFLDGKYAIFGQVIEGMELVDKIAIGDKMKKITVTVQ